MGKECKEFKKWVEEQVEKPIDQWVEKTEKKCKKRKWYDPRRWICWLVTTFVKVVRWVVVTVTKWVTYVVCKIVNVVIDVVTSPSLWKEGDYVDFWSVVHFLTGLVIGLFLCLLKAPLGVALPIVVILLILWEIFEYYHPEIHETWPNLILDVLIGIVGFFIAFFLFPQLWALFILLLLVLVILNILGWTATKRRKRAKQKNAKNN